ncbi:hypothetical protein HU200_033955 [Digitaria exilis]|uniref:Cytochrome P450 n=1 Tax=Digitaria exilis TaxID=1010633 RepID=A0A835BKQ7_9POAL|nr:hypothetical protein HU200_033955 [Digitaria exilis]
MAVRHLLCPSMVRAHRAVREQEVAALLRRWEHQCHTTAATASAFAKDVAGRIVLGRLRVAAEDDDGWRAKVDALLATFHVGDYVPCLSWVSAVDGTDAKVRKAFKRIYRILEEIVGDADRQVVEAGALDNDAAFVHLLLSLQKGESAGLTEWRLSRDNVKALLEDLFGAGTEATIILLRDKGAMQRLQHEVRRAAADNESSLQITEQDLPGMEYLRAVIKETMRLHTPGPLLLPREAMRATRIQGHHDAPAGAMVIVNALGRRRRSSGRRGSSAARWTSAATTLPADTVRRRPPDLALANLVVVRFEWALPEAEPELDMEEARPGAPEANSM